MRLRYIEDRLFLDNKPGEHVQSLQRPFEFGNLKPCDASLMVVAPAIPFRDSKENMDGLAMFTGLFCLFDILRNWTLLVKVRSFDKVFLLGTFVILESTMLDM